VGFIEALPEGEVTGAVAQAYEADLAEDGYVSNVTRAFSHQPEVYEAWVALRAPVTKAPYAALEESLHSALVVGRPIEGT
jgi:hypothetical protein